MTVKRHSAEDGYTNTKIVSFSTSLYKTRKMLWTHFFPMFAFDSSWEHQRGTKLINEFSFLENLPNISWVYRVMNKCLFRLQFERCSSNHRPTSMIMSHIFTYLTQSFTLKHLSKRRLSFVKWQTLCSMNTEMANI